MARRRLQVCLTPGCPELQTAPRCPEHQRDQNRHHRTTTPTKATRDTDRSRRKATVDAHRAEHGDWCPGWGVPAHPSADLTADHIDEISLGGDPTGALQVLCRGCNSRKAQRNRRTGG